MSIFKTYKEAVLANGSTKGVYINLMTGWFQLDISHPGSWVECNPVNYLESLESFLASGKRLVDGDLTTYLNGAVKSVENPKIMNTFADSQNQRYVLQAAADQVETPKKKEAFDAIDTTPRQVESLGNAGWNGEGLPPIGERFCVDDYDTVMLCKYSSEYVVVGEMTGEQYPEGVEVVIDLKQTPNRKFCKPESQAEREERERLEAAYDLYCASVNAIALPVMPYNVFITSTFQVASMLAIVDKTGYRKECKQ